MPHSRARSNYSLLDDGVSAPGLHSLANVEGTHNESSRQSKRRTSRSGSGSLSHPRPRSSERRQNRNFSGTSIAEKRPPTPPHNSTPATHPSILAGSPHSQKKAVFAESSGPPGHHLSKPRRNSRPLTDYSYVEPLDITDATAHNLTHATNTILIPPIPFYRQSRAPLQPPSPRLGKPDEELGRLVEKDGDNQSTFRQMMRGVWKFLKTPKGIITAIYGFLVAFWGAAIVLFLTKIINLHDANKQGIWVEISSQIENGLFTITGIGLIPFRAIDTYRMVRIWQIKRRARMLRSVAGLSLVDEDDILEPERNPQYAPVLTVDEQNELQNHQLKFQHSQTWYRPYATETNRAFSTETALIICCLNDGNSAFQILLCVVMWGLNRHNRPPWTTGLLIPCAFGCAIGAAVLAWRGGRATQRSGEDVKARAALVVGNRRVSTAGPEHMPLGDVRSFAKR